MTIDWLKVHDDAEDLRLFKMVVMLVSGFSRSGWFGYTIVILSIGLRVLCWNLTFAISKLSSIN